NLKILSLKLWEIAVSHLKINKPNPYANAYRPKPESGSGFKLYVLKNPTGHDITQRYNLGRELGRGEFGVTYLCTDSETGERFACKSILKKKLRTSVDIEDVQREVEIMKHLPKHPNIVTIKDTYEDNNAVHIVMELCEGGELFDRIVARGHYTERAAAAIMRTIVEVNFRFTPNLIVTNATAYHIVITEHPWLFDAKAAPNVSLGEVVRSRLKQFSVMNKLKKQALIVIAEHLSVDEVSGIKEMFDMMDTSKRGKINLEELRIGLQKLGQLVNDADLQVLMESVSFVIIFTLLGSRVDLDGDGTLNYNEFVAVNVHLKRMANDEHLHKAFGFFDRNRSGYIEVDELRYVLSDDEENIDGIEEVIHAIMHDVDTDKDGRISYEEFAAMMKAGTDWRKASRQYSRERLNSLGL
ncbi:LOW QUALITY PROTEIN: hypothetical protein M8C21_011327, partial [Ambrosia artemisiifolia]